MARLLARQAKVLVFDEPMASLGISQKARLLEIFAVEAIRQGIIAGEVAAGQNSSYDNVVVPAVIFSDPEIAIARRR